MGKSEPENRKVNLWMIGTLLVVLAYISGLFIDLTGDSGLYAAISRQMVESKDWLNLKINGQPYDQKPHLFFWLAGVGISMFGNTNFAFKLFLFIYGIAGIYFTYRLGKLLFTEVAGRWAAVMTASSQIYFLYFMDIHTDSILQTGVIFALWQLAGYLKNRKPVNFVAGFTGIGMAMLSKGPVGAILPFLFVLTYLIRERDIKQLLHPKWLVGILIVLIIIAPALVHLYKNFGPDGIRFYFITNNFGRISGGYAGSSRDPFFYLYNMIWAFLPWTAIVFASLFREIKSYFLEGNNDKWGFPLSASLLFIFLVLSIAKGKSPNYMLIIIAPTMVLTAKWLTKEKHENKRIHLNPNRMLVLFLLAGIFNIFLNGYLLPRLFKYQGPRQVLNIFEKHSNSDKKLYNFEIDEYALFFYAKEIPENLTDWNRVYSVLEKPDTWIYTNNIKYNDITGMEYKIDTIYEIKNRGMNKMSFQFLNPLTRQQSLKTHYLIKTK